MTATTAPLNEPEVALTQEEKDLEEYERHAADAFAGKQPEPDLANLGSKFLDEFNQAELLRRPTERRWLQDLRQYKGKYDPEEEKAIGELRSKSYVRKTRVKVKTVDSRVADLLFPAGNDKNWEINPTPVPNVSDAQRAKVMQQMVAMARQALAAQAQQAGQQFDPSQVGDPPKDTVDAAILTTVKKAAKGMSKVMEDQLVESRYKQSALQVLHSGHLYGTGILKGPLVERRTRTRFEQVGENWVAREESYLVPFVESVPIWRWYPDMSVTTLDQCRFVYERHTFTRAALFALTTNKSFKKEKILDHLKANANGLVKKRDFDHDLKAIGEREGDFANDNGQYEVLERWGYIDGATLVGLGIKVPEERMEEAFFSNVWVLPNGVVIKAVLQPINGVTWPYHLYYFDKDETSIFGEGLSSIMRDDQKMLNAATRLQIDNAAITSGPMLEVDVTMLSKMEDATDIRPWKVFLRNGTQPGSPAVRPINITANLEWLSNMARQFDTNADEVTAIPRYMAGENVNSGAAGTASGMSMLMGAVNIVIKDLITGYDEGITTPFLQALYRWNMQFNKDPAIKGDFDVYARGTASLVAKEVRARQLNEFSQLTANELDIPFVKRHKLNQLRAEALEMTDVIKTEDEVKAETDGGAVQQQQQAAMEMQKAQLAEQQAKAGRLVAETELAKAKVAQLVATLELNIAQMKADAAHTEAETALLIEKKVGEKVASVFAALQAGGVATLNPTTAPAGDEILKSAGWEDETPDRSIDMLNGPPVQEMAGTHQLLNNGQSFAEEPRGMDAMPPEMEPQALAAPESTLMPAQPEPEPQTGRVGLEQGIETPVIEGAPL